MSDRRWIRMTRCDSIPVREGRAVTVAGHTLAIFNLGERFLATVNECPHQGGPLCDGIVAGDTVVCPLHGWKVKLETGAIERPAGNPACVPAFETRIENGEVLVALPETMLKGCAA